MKSKYISTIIYPKIRDFDINQNLRLIYHYYSSDHVEISKILLIQRQDI